MIGAVPVNRDQARRRTCRKCERPFIVTTDEVLRLEAIAARAGWDRVNLPNRCTDCRFAARRARFTEPSDQASADTDRWCVDCSQPFVWPLDEGERAYFATRGWPAPRRCASCRQARRGVRA